MAVNRWVAGSSPARGANFFKDLAKTTQKAIRLGLQRGYKAHPGPQTARKRR
jgi:hypothetical protein